MLIPKILAILNTLLAATLLICIAAYVQIGGAHDVHITPAMLVEASKGPHPLDPQFSIELLSRDAEHWRHRAQVLQWLCYAALGILIINTFFWTKFSASRKNAII